MRTLIQIQALVAGLVAADNATKQELGQRFARGLGLVPGPRGPDDGIDGSVNHNGKKVHFQCRLRSLPLDVDDARRYYSDLMFHHVDISIMLAGVGYKDTFRDKLFGHPGIEQVRVHLLTLADVFEESAAYRSALEDLPSITVLSTSIDPSPSASDEMPT